jgi:flagellar biosynthesis GTPase FlhF
MSKLVTNARKLPGLVVGTTMQAARLPLTAAAKAAGQAGNDEWPPSLMFEGVEAAVETTVGGLLRDDTLVSRGRLRQARITKLKEAAQLEAIAESERTDAQDELAARKQAADKRREQIEETAEQREKRLEQEAAKRKQEVAKTAAHRKAATAKQTAAQRKQLEKQERDAKLAAAEAESKALSKEKAALVAEDTAVALDDAIDVNREARTGS